MASIAPLRGKQDDPTLAGRLAHRRASQLFAAFIIGLVVLMTFSVFAGFRLTRADEEALNAARHLNREALGFQQALVDAETGVRGYVLNGEPAYLEPYGSGLNVLDTASAELLAQLDGLQPSRPAPGSGGGGSVTETVRALRGVWSQAIALAGAHDLPGARDVLVTLHGKALMDRLRAAIGVYLARRDAAAIATERHISAEASVVLLLNLVGAACAVGALVYAFDRSIRDGWRRELAIRDHSLARRQVEHLFVMAEMLQSATDREDAHEVLRATGRCLLPGMSGALYVFNNSRDRLDLATTWQDDDAAPANAAEHLTPSSCWALKRGKPHRNEDAPGSLRCAHASEGGVSLEIPMAARGELYGLLAISALGEDAMGRLSSVQPIAAALADAMSLALSSITLRERLRNQALRDPLTGLYNRRFLEEMIERLSQEAERRRAPLSAIMLDLDHFKLLNDQLGHATGDAVLRQVAATVMAALRGSDVACRYGGEEFAILLPDCSLEQAAKKAELIRAAIAGMSVQGRSPQVTASLGVACVPETTARAAELLQSADGALYSAKQQGRDRAACAPLRHAAPMLVAG